MNFHTTEDGRWVLGDKNARCPKCDAPAAVHYATNGKAEIWHPPTDCCAWSRAREQAFHRMSIDDDRRTQEAADRARGWPSMQDVA